MSTPCYLPPADGSLTSPIDSYEYQNRPELFVMAYNTIVGQTDRDFYTYKFRFNYPDNVNHPFGLFYDAENRYPYETDLFTTSEDQLTWVLKPEDDMPFQLFYGCKLHPGKMGGVINIIRRSDV